MIDLINGVKIMILHHQKKITIEDNLKNITNRNIALEMMKTNEIKGLEN